MARIESHGEDPSQNPGRCTNNTHRSVNTSSDVADEEQFFFTQTDGQNETEQPILQ